MLSKCQSPVVLNQRHQTEVKIQHSCATCRGSRSKFTPPISPNDFQHSQTCINTTVSTSLLMWPSLLFPFSQKETWDKSVANFDEQGKYLHVKTFSLVISIKSLSSHEIYMLQDQGDTSIWCLYYWNHCFKQLFNVLHMFIWCQVLSFPRSHIIHFSFLFTISKTDKCPFHITPEIDLSKGLNIKNSKTLLESPSNMLLLYYYNYTIYNNIIIIVYPGVGMFNLLNFSNLM